MDPILEAVDEAERLPVVPGRATADAIVLNAWEAHHQELHGFIAHAVRDDAAADDLLQECFVRLVNEARSGRAPEQVRAWLYRVASNLIISRGRRRSTVVRWLTTHAAATYDAGVGGSPEAGYLAAERFREMEAALASLPADARVALVLSSSGFSGMEIAETIGRSHLATRAMLTRARIKVRRELSGEDAR